MSVLYGMTQAAAITSGSTQSFTDVTNLGGVTPEWAIIVVSYATVAGTVADHGVISIGITDGTTMFSKCLSSEDNVNPSDTERVHSTDHIVSLIDPTGSATWEARANLSGGGMIANGITINWDDLPSAAYLVTCFFCGGTSANSALGSSSSITTTTTPFGSLGLGGTPDLVFLLSAMTTNASNTIATHGRLSVGVGDGTNAWSQAKGDQNNQSPTKSYAHTGTTDAADILSTTTITASMDVENFGIDTFDMNPATDWASNDISYLALYNGGAGVDVQVFTAPGSVTTKSATMAFEPAAGIMLFSRQTSTNSFQTDASATNWGISFFNGTLEYSIEISTADNSTTSNTKSRVTAKAMDNYTSGGVAENVATVQSVNADGWTFDFTTSSLANKSILISFEGAGAGLSLIKLTDETVDINGEHSTDAEILLIDDEVENISEDIVSLVTLVTALVKVVTENINIVETITSSMTLLRFAADIINLPEGVVSSQALTRVADETLNIEEQLSKTLGKFKVIDENISISEGILKALGKVITFDESVSIQEDVLKAILKIIVADENVSIDEAINQALAKIIFNDETVSLNEDTVKAMAKVRAVDELLNLEEALVSSLQLNRTFNDTVSLIETLATAKGLAVIISEVLNTLETTPLLKTFIVVIDEVINSIETFLRSMDLNRLINETEDTSENVTKSREQVRLFNEAQNLVEQIQLAFTFVRLFNETVNTVESLTISKVMVKIFSDAMNISEAIVANTAVIIIQGIAILEGSLKSIAKLFGSKS